MVTLTVFGRLELELCERKILLPGWWLEAGAGGIGERFTVALEGSSPAERSDYFLGRGARAPQYYNFCVIESC